MSPKQGETPTPKRKPGRPPKAQQAVQEMYTTEPATASSGGRTPAEAVTDQELAAWIEEAREEGYDRGKEEGYREGFAAAQQKNRLPLFEATRKWALAAADDLGRHDTIRTAERLFEEFEASYGDERLNYADRNLIFLSIKQKLRRRENLATHGEELPAETKRQLKQTVEDDFETVVVG